MTALAVPSGLAALVGARLVGADAAFYGVFGVFVVAFAVLAFVSIRWGIRRDRAARAEWVRRRQLGEGALPAFGDDVPGADPTRMPRPPQTNGHIPRRPGRKGRERNQPG